MSDDLVPAERSVEDVLEDVWDSINKWLQETKEEFLNRLEEIAQNLGRVRELLEKVESLLRKLNEKIDDLPARQVAYSLTNDALFAAKMYGHIIAGREKPENEDIVELRRETYHLLRRFNMLVRSGTVSFLAPTEFTCFLKSMSELMSASGGGQQAKVARELFELATLGAEKQYTEELVRVERMIAPLAVPVPYAAYAYLPGRGRLVDGWSMEAVQAYYVEADSGVEDGYPNLRYRFDETIIWVRWGRGSTPDRNAMEADLRAKLGIGRERATGGPGKKDFITNFLRETELPRLRVAADNYATLDRERKTLKSSLEASSLFAKPLEDIYMKLTSDGR